jgi:hypothetical protein
MAMQSLTAHLYFIPSRSRSFTMTGSTSSGKVVKAKRPTAIAAVKKWEALVPAKAKAKASKLMLVSKSHKPPPNRKWQPSVSKSQSEEEAVVAKSVKRAHIVPEVEEVVSEPIDIDASQSAEDVVEVGNGGDSKEEDVSPYIRMQQYNHLPKSSQKN